MTGTHVPPQWRQPGPQQVPGPALAGFERINRYWDPMHNMVAAKILPGEYYVTQEDETIVTVLGSCVAACIRDRIFNIGGMNHFMLPESHNGDGHWHAADNGTSTRYGSYAMEQLINAIFRNGGQRKNLEVKIFGGGRVLAQMTDIGRRNIEFVHDYLRTEALSLVAEDTGDVFPRKVYYFPATGRVRVLKMRALHNATIIERELAYRQAIEAKAVGGEIELF
jgi:chemotaxis protein CheD